MNTYHRHSFANGLELISVPMPHVKSATVLVMVGVGSRYETKEINGLSHFLEHMAFKGSKKRPSSLLISSTIDAIGGEFNAFTSKDHTGFYIKARSAHIPLLLDVLSDMILHPILAPEEIEREKGVIIEEINMYEDLPMRHIADVYEELLYPNHPLGRDTAGKADTVRKMTRDHFLSYIDRLYRPNNAVVVVAGGLNRYQGKLISLVDSALSSWPKQGTPKWKKVSEDQKKPEVKLKYKPTQQAHLIIGTRGYAYEHPLKYPLSVLSAIVGGGMSSRLFIQVRERRGLAYYIRSDTEHYLDVGNFQVQAGVDVARIDEAIRVILDEFEGLKYKRLEVTKKELKKAKEYLKGRLTLELEDSRTVAALYATQEILKRKVRTPEEIMAKTQAVKLDEIYHVAEDLFVPEKLNLAVIGPFKEESKFLKLLQ